MIYFRRLTDKTTSAKNRRKELDVCLEIADDLCRKVLEEECTVHSSQGFVYKGCVGSSLAFGRRSTPVARRNGLLKTAERELTDMGPWPPTLGSLRCVYAVFTLLAAGALAASDHKEGRKVFCYHSRNSNRTIYNYAIRDIHQKRAIDWSAYRNQVVLVTNVASW